MAEDPNILASDGLPDLWRFPTGLVGESFRFLHAEMCARIRGENPDCDTMELMAIERVVTVYLMLRTRERKQAGDAAYRVLFQTWVSVSTELRKIREGKEGVQKSLDRILAQVNTAMETALGEMNPQQAASIRKRFSETLEKV